MNMLHHPGASGSPSNCLRTIACLCLFLLLVATAGCRPPDESAQSKSPDPGVTATEVRLGSSLALQGHASFLGTQTLRGAMCYLAHVNESGGVDGRQIR